MQTRTNPVLVPDRERHVRLSAYPRKRTPVPDHRSDRTTRSPSQQRQQIDAARQNCYRENISSLDPPQLVHGWILSQFFGKRHIKSTLVELRAIPRVTDANIATAHCVLRLINTPLQTSPYPLNRSTVVSARYALVLPVGVQRRLVNFRFNVTGAKCKNLAVRRFVVDLLDSLEESHFSAMIRRVARHDLLWIAAGEETD